MGRGAVSPLRLRFIRKSLSDEGSFAKKPDLVSIAFVFGNCAAANVIGSQPSATRNQCRLTIAVQKARVIMERVVFPLFQVS